MKAQQTHAKVRFKGNMVVIDSGPAIVVLTRAQFRAVLQAELARRQRARLARGLEQTNDAW